MMASITLFNKDGFGVCIPPAQGERHSLAIAGSAYAKAVFCYMEVSYA